MNNSILIIDDESIQANNLRKALASAVQDVSIDVATTELEISRKISESYFNIAIVDLRMDDFKINGFEIIKDIIELNPIAKIIVVSAYTKEFESDINDIIKSGKVSAVISKEKFDVFKENIIRQINTIIDDFESDPTIISSALQYLYSDVKKETNSYKKGIKFEYFISNLFSQMGFNHINKRIIDKSSNEVDLVVRNDIADSFFQKFKPYFLVECKNTSTEVDKNQFIQFRSKLENTNSLANLGFIFTTTGFKRTSYLESLRGSKDPSKIIFVANADIIELITSEDLLSHLKKIIDYQIKDN